MAALGVCSDFLLKSLGSMLIILGASAVVKGFFPMTNFLVQVQLLPNMIATGLLYL